MKNFKGFSLPELLTVVAIGGILSLTMASVFSFAAQQFNSIIDQNEAEESLLLASFYVRSTLSQAVKLHVYANDPITVPPVPAFGTLDSVTPPLSTAKGYFNSTVLCGDSICTNGGGWSGAAGAIQTLALFVRENGDPTAANPVSQYIPTGIFYRTPNGAAPGRIYIGQAPTTGGTFVLTDSSATANSIVSSYFFDRFVAFGISNSNPASCTIGGAAPYGGAMECVNLYMRARYFKGISNAKDYNPNQATAATTSLFRDIDLVVNVGLRNNVLGISTTGTTTGGLPVYERLYGGIYFFKFQAPDLISF